MGWEVVAGQPEGAIEGGKSSSSPRIEICSPSSSLMLFRNNIEYLQNICYAKGAGEVIYTKKNF